MASRLQLPFLLLLLFPLLAPSESKLSLDYYNKTCPNFAKIVRNVAVDKQMEVPTTAAGALRLFFHDCIVGGCDASLLLSSTTSSTAERDHEINKALPGDAFDVVNRAKSELELECPGIVSCSDILAQATRDLLAVVGAPHYQIHLGRKDSRESRAGDVEGHVARSNMSMTQIIEIFAGKGFTVQEMVALTGAHTIGFAHCSEFAHRIFRSDPDPTLNAEYAERLRSLCQNYTTDSTMAAFNDPITPGRFDNVYYRNLRRGVGLLASDEAMASDLRTKKYVNLYADDQTAFFRDFSRAMEKVSVQGVKIGAMAEVRRRCDVVN